MSWNPPANVIPIDRKSPSAASHADIPAVLDWLRDYYPAHTVIGVLITARAERLTYRVDAEPPYGTTGSLSNYTLTTMDWDREQIDAALADIAQTTAANTAQTLAVLGITDPYISYSTDNPPVGPNGTKGSKLTALGRVYGTVADGDWLWTDSGAALTGQPELAVLIADALTDLRVQPATYARVRARVAAGQQVRVALWGDSRSEGADTFDGVDANYNGPGGLLTTRPGGDAYAIRLEKQLRQLFPDLAFQNFSLGSRNIWMAENVDYKATASEPADPANGFTRPWSTVGKSWKQHVQDWQPDLVIIAHDINSAWSADGVDTYHVTPLLALLDELQAWPAAPDIALVAGSESTIDLSKGMNPPAHVRAAARANREIARVRHLPLIDAHRLFRLWRWGQDDVTTRTRVVTLAQYATEFSGDTAQFGVWASGSDRYLVHDAAVRIASVQVGWVRDFRLEAEISLPTVAALGILKFRQDTVSGAEYLLHTFTQGGPNNGGNGGFRLYWLKGGTLVSLGGVDANIPAGASIPLEIDAIGSKIFIRANIGGNWVTVVDTDHYPGQYDGAISFAIDANASATWKIKRILLREPLAARGWSNDTKMFGPPRLNPDATDGNNGNHPDGWGHAAFYLPACGGVLNGLQTIAKPISSETSIDLTPYLSAGWTWFGGGWHRPKAAKAGSRISVSGMLLRNAGAGATILTLPAGYRPSGDTFESSDAAPGRVRMICNSAGQVNLEADGSVAQGQWISLSLSLLD